METLMGSLCITKKKPGGNLVSVPDGMWKPQSRGFLDT